MRPFAVLFIVVFTYSLNMRSSIPGDPLYPVKQVSRELGVRYILEGSVRKAGNRIRVTAQLIDGKRRNHVWAEKYDGEVEDIAATIGTPPPQFAEADGQPRHQAGIITDDDPVSGPGHDPCLGGETDGRNA